MPCRDSNSTAASVKIAKYVIFEAKLATFSGIDLPATATDVRFFSRNIAAVKVF